MVGEAIPIDASGGSPSYTAAEWRQAQAALLMNGTSDPFGARAGRRPGGGMIATAPTPTTYSVSAGSYIAMPGFSANQGAYLCQFPAAEVGSINAQVANPRIDILQVIVDDASAGDGSSNRRARVVYKAGTASSSPSAPALDTRANLLATINVPATGGGSPTVTMGPMAVGNGGVLPVADNTERGAITTPYAGMFVYEMNSGRLYVYSGAAWVLVQLANGKVMISGTTSTTTNGVGGFAIAFGVTFSSPPVVVGISASDAKFNGWVTTDAVSTTAWSAIARAVSGGVIVGPAGAPIDIAWHAHGTI